jgi:short-subunit dehydrogenase
MERLGSGMKRRVAIVTGASSGIGRALAERAVRGGWNVVAVGRRAERLGELATLVDGATGSLVTLALDLRSPQAAERIVAAALEAFGAIDVLVNNAGGVAVGPIAQQSDAALREQVETHIVVPLALTREALPSLRIAKGQIFYVGSGVARIPVGTLGAYPPVKAAVRNMARIARNELRGDGIAVTYIDPGAVATEFMTRAGFAGPSPNLAASPYDVARKIFAAFATRRPVVNAVPWQTFFVALGEALPALTDYILSRAPQIVGGEPVAAPPVAAIEAPAELAEPEAPPATSFDAALAPLESRMRRLKLRATFVRELLVTGAELEAGDVALRWAGMPNKNERALTHDVLAALAQAGYLALGEPDTYRVLREAEV